MFAKIGAFLMERKKWWEIPLILVFFIVIMILLSPQKISATPFIYMLY